jgi:4-amino-4-deoxy-L-arabinose transferase-like glycosyltransferase
MVSTGDLNPHWFGHPVISWRLYNYWIAPSVALIFAVASLHVLCPSNTRSDIGQVAAMLVCCYFIVSAAEGEKLSDFLLSGAFLGLAVAAKWPSVVLCILIVPAAALSHRQELRTPRPYLFMVAAAIEGGPREAAGTVKRPAITTSHPARQTTDKTGLESFTF